MRIYEIDGQQVSEAEWEAASVPPATSLTMRDDEVNTDGLPVVFSGDNGEVHSFPNRAAFYAWLDRPQRKAVTG